MKCAPRAGWIFVGFGVAISLLLAIFVLALANSNRRVCGLSGSKRIPWEQKGGYNEGGRTPMCSVPWACVHMQVNDTALILSDVFAEENYLRNMCTVY